MKAENAANKILEVYKVNHVSEEDLGFDIENFKDWNWIKSRLWIQTISTKGNEKLIKNSVHFNKFGLTGIVYVKLDVPSGDFGKITILEDYVQYWNVTKDEVISAAKSNLANNIKIVALIDGVPMLSLTSNDYYYGASVMFSAEARRKLKEMTGWNSFYILPSSVHDVIAIPKDDGVDPNELIKMVKHVNKYVVDPEDRLCNNVFVCDEDNDLSMVVGEVEVTTI